MSFLSRLSARARPPGSAAPLLMPKGFVRRHAGTVYREEEAAEEQKVAPKRAMRARALRRQQPLAAEEDEAELSRAAAPEQSEEEPADEMRPLRRAADTEPEPMEGEEEVRAVRRAAASAAGPESEGEEEEGGQPARLIRRAEEVPLDDGDRPPRQPFLSDLEPGAAPTHPDLAGEEEPSDLQALRRDAAPHLSAHGESGGTGRATQGSGLPDHVSPSNPGFRDRPGGIGSAAFFETKYGTFLEPRGIAGASAEPPTVIIDHLDVLIHESAPSPSAARTIADHGRMLRARYLRSL